MHIHLTDLQHTCLEITKKQQRSYDPSNLSKTIQNQNHQYLLIPRANSPPKKMENEVPGPPQLSPRMLPNAPGTPQDPADLQGTPQEHSRAPRGRSQDPSRTPQDSPSVPAAPPGTLHRASRTPSKHFQDTSGTEPPASENKATRFNGLGHQVASAESRSVYNLRRRPSKRRLKNITNYVSSMFHDFVRI